MEGRAVRAFRYLSGIEKTGVLYVTNEEGTIPRYIGADRASERLLSKSIAETELTHSEGTIYWRSKEQCIVAKSSKE